MDSPYDYVVEVLIPLLLLHNKPIKYIIAYKFSPFLLPDLDMHVNEEYALFYSGFQVWLLLLQKSF